MNDTIFGRERIGGPGFGATVISQNRIGKEAESGAIRSRLQIHISEQTKMGGRTPLEYLNGMGSIPDEQGNFFGGDIERSENTAFGAEEVTTGAGNQGVGAFIYIDIPALGNL